MASSAPYTSHGDKKMPRGGLGSYRGLDSGTLLVLTGALFTHSITCLLTSTFLAVTESFRGDFKLFPREFSASDVEYPSTLELSDSKEMG